MATTKDDGPRQVGIRHFRRAIAKFVDDAEPIAITKNNKLAGYYVPAGQPVPHDEPEPEPEPEPDDDNGPIVIGQVTASDGQRWHELRRIGKLTINDIFARG